MKPTQIRIIVIFLVTATTGAVLDIASKRKAFDALNGEILGTNVVERRGNAILLQEPVHPVVEGRFQIRLRLNPGAVWGILGDRPYLLLLLSGAAIVFIITILVHSGASTAPIPIALGLICAGAAGNLWDRIFFGGVRDFLHFYWNDPIAMSWPTFNLADVFICIGVGLYLFIEIFAPQEDEEKEESPPPVTAENDS